MVYLKLHRDEPEPEAPAPIPFRSPDRSWRMSSRTGQEHDTDPIAQANAALERAERNLDELSRHVDEYAQPFRLSDWRSDEDDDGPWAA